MTGGVYNGAAKNGRGLLRPLRCQARLPRREISTDGSLGWVVELIAGDESQSQEKCFENGTSIGRVGNIGSWNGYVHPRSQNEMNYLSTSLGA